MAGWRDFEVIAKRENGAIISSFALRPSTAVPRTAQALLAR
jgi:hypothetical protein